MSCGERASDSTYGFSNSFSGKVSSGYFDNNGGSESPPEEEGILLNQELRIGKVAEKLIKIGEIRMEVKNYASARAALSGVVKNHDASVFNEQEDQTHYRIENTIVVRVAQKNFDGLFDAIVPIAHKVHAKETNVKNVTEEFVDIQSRLKTKREILNRYYDILKKADSIADVLKVEAKIGMLQEEIEAKEGRLRFLQDQVQFSTIKIYLYENLDPDEPLIEEESFFSELSDSFLFGWKGLLGFMLVLARLWPMFFIIALVVFGVRRWLRKSKAK